MIIVFGVISILTIIFSELWHMSIDICVHFSLAAWTIIFLCIAIAIFMRKQKNITFRVLSVAAFVFYEYIIVFFFSYMRLLDVIMSKPFKEKVQFVIGVVIGVLISKYLFSKINLENVEENI